MSALMIFNTSGMYYKKNYILPFKSYDQFYFSSLKSTQVEYKPLRIGRAAICLGPRSFESLKY